MRMRLIARHRDAQLYALSNAMNFNYFEVQDRRRVLSGMIVPFQYVCSKLTVNVMDDFSKFQPIDATPSWSRLEPKSVEDYNIFNTPLVKTQEIILPEPTVDSLLDQLLSMQSERDKKYYQEQVRANRDGMIMESTPQTKFHAQIISLAA